MTLPWNWQRNERYACTTLPILGSGRSALVNWQRNERYACTTLPIRPEGCELGRLSG